VFHINENLAGLLRPLGSAPSKFTFEHFQTIQVPQANHKQWRDVGVGVAACSAEWIPAFPGRRGGSWQAKALAGLGHCGRGASRVDPINQSINRTTL
jgi:hypothetical protein